MKHNYSTQQKAIFRSTFILLLLFNVCFGIQAQTFTVTFNYTGSMQQFTVPPQCVSTLTIQAKGAMGGNHTTSTFSAGLGADLTGVFTVTPNQVLKILVGQQPSQTTLGNGGGGGSFVTDLANNPLIVAGGGGGSAQGADSPSKHGQVSTSGGNGSSGGGIGGTGGNGGSIGATFASGAGGGMLTNGATGWAANTGGIAFVNGGNSTAQAAIGGFGGGGSGSSYVVGGGGGGYSGGGSGSNSTAAGGTGGGGGSYNGGTNQINLGGSNAGHGQVIITYALGIPLAATASPSAVCTGGSSTLSATGMITYTWLPVGTFTGSNSSTITEMPAATTVYTVQGTNSQGCLSTAILTVNLSGSLPTLTVVSSATQLCLGKTATLTASGALSYTWTGGVTNGVSFYPSATSSYTVSGQNGCGITTAVSAITIAPLPVSVVSTGTAVCTNKTATLSVTAAATSYTWQPGNVVTTNSNFIVNPQANTIYTVSATDGTCSGVANISLQADPVPSITSSASSTIVCPGGSVVLSATGGVNYTWTPGNQNTSNITVNPTLSTLYTVTGDNSFGCLNSSSQVIVVGVQPTIALVASSTTVCIGNTATLTATGAGTYAWTGGPTTASYVVNPTQNTSYTVVGTNTSSGCFDTKSVTISVFDPTVTITGNTVICNGAQANIMANGANGYTWSPGSLPFQSISVSPSSSITYTVDALASLGALTCPASATVQITVNPNPTITTSSTKPAICIRETNTLTASGASTYSWINTNTTVVAPSITITANNATTVIYTVTGVSSLGCESSFVQAINIFACTAINEEDLSTTHLTVYPNPNTGNFIIRGERELKLDLINEIGQQLKEIELNNLNGFSASVGEMPQGFYFIIGPSIKEKIVITK